MNSTVFYLVLVGASLLMAVLPFGVFMGLGTVLGIPAGDSRLVMTYIVLAVALAYAISLGAFSIIQKSNCGEVNNFKQVALSGLFTAGFQILMLGLAVGFPWFAGIVGNLLPPDSPVEVTKAVVMAYYSFWATMFGMAIGGTMSGSCGATVTTATPA
jgi:hypothetical protein